jgi:hypothetical protein
VAHRPPNTASLRSGLCPATERVSVRRHIQDSLRATALLILVGVACGGDRSVSCDVLAVRSDTAAQRYYSEHAMDYRAERLAVGPVSARVCRTSGTLRIQQRGGRPFRLTDTLVEGDRWRTYLYERFDSALRSHVVKASFYESGVVMLIPDSAGPVVALDDEPVLSPDLRRFAVASLDLEAGYQPNAIDVWRIVDTGAVREFRVEAEGWGPDSLTWSAPDSISFLRVSHDTAGPTVGLRFVRVPQRLVWQNGKWRIVRAP